MSLKWTFLICAIMVLRSGLCTKQEPHMKAQSISVDDSESLNSDDSEYATEKRLEASDTHSENHMPHSVDEDNGFCSASPGPEGHCNVPVDPQLDDNIKNDENTLEEDSSSDIERKRKSSGWLSDWDPFSATEEEEAAATSLQNEHQDEEKSYGRESAVTVLHKKGDFEKFLRTGHVVIVFFYKDVQSESLQRFLGEYDVSSDHLLQYGIYLALADCNVYSIRHYCSEEKVNKFAYGFREGQEKIAFPLDTLFNNNAIVASALHLDLINTVPILQTSGERRELERRCKGRCDIIFSFQRTLGTYEHRMFLEIAHAYQDSYVFAITTYTAGTLGLSDNLPEDNEDVEQRVWVVHCADKTPRQQCVVSHFRRKMLLTELLQFMSALQLPKWHDLDVSPTKDVVITPYDGTSLPWVLLIYDSSCKHRVMGLAPDLALLLHGTVATITVDLDRINEKALESLGLKRINIVAPAIAFLHEGQEKTSLLNDYDDPLEWVNEQLAVIFEKPQSKEEMGYQPVQALEELLQDDEVVMDMQREESFTNVSPLSGPDAYATAIKSNVLTVIAFYLAWDPVSSMMLQHMNDIVPHLGQIGSQAALHRINCFDWPKLCDGIGIAGYPELRMYPKNKPNVTYTGPIHSESLMKTILLYGNPPPLELKNADEMERFLSLEPDFHQACYLMHAVAVGIFPTMEDSVPFIEAAHSLKSSHLTGRFISKQATKDICSKDSGCIVISKPKDLLQPRTVLESGLDNSSKITTLIRHTSDFVMAPLDFERLSLLSSVNGMEGPPSIPNQYLILLFIPADSSLPYSRGDESHSSKTMENTRVDNSQETSKRNIPSTDEVEMWSVIGRLAVEFSEPGFVFSYIKGDEPLAEKLTAVYQLVSSDFNLVAVNWRQSAGLDEKEAKGDPSDKRGIRIYTCPDLSPRSLRPWLISLKEGLFKPSVVLGENDWEPRLPGFDYIKFMMEDEDRDGEDHLMMEMESDLTLSSHQGEDGEGLLHMHKEL